MDLVYLTKLQVFKNQKLQGYNVLADPCGQAKQNLRKV